MKEIKLIACDLDGTLMDLACAVDARDGEALRYASERGVTVAVCTGRAIHHIPRSVRSMDFIRYYITSNGARVTDIKTGETLALTAIPKELVLAVVDAIEPLGATFNIHGDGYDLSDYENYELLKKLGGFDDFVSMGCAVKLSKDFRALVREEESALQKMLIMFHTQEETDAAWRALGAIGGIQVTTSFAKTLEVTAAGVRKDMSLDTLCGKLGVSREQTAAIGDSENDVDMLRFAGVGIAMGNAGEGAKKAADYVTATIAEAGVAKAVKDILKI